VRQLQNHPEFLGALNAVQHGDIRRIKYLVVFFIPKYVWAFNHSPRDKPWSYSFGYHFELLREHMALANNDEFDNHIVNEWFFNFLYKINNDLSLGLHYAKGAQVAVKYESKEKGIGASLKATCNGDLWARFKYQVSDDLRAFTFLHSGTRVHGKKLNFGLGLEKSF